jgi:hypothetical protein
MEEKSIFDQPQPNYKSQQQLPNATIVLVMGILSIVMCFVGLILGIIGLVLANKDMKLYNSGPELYSSTSYSNLKTGRICSIIGLTLNGGLALIYIVIIIVAIATAGGNMF